MKMGNLVIDIDCETSFLDVGSDRGSLQFDRGKRKTITTDYLVSQCDFNFRSSGTSRITDK